MVHFPTKHLGRLVLYIGCEYRHGLEKGVPKLTQTKYVQRITEMFLINKTAATHLYVSSPFKVEGEEDYKGRYREAVGSLVCLSNNTRPDITDAARAASRHGENPTPENWQRVLRFFEYPISIVDLGIAYERGSSKELLEYADAGSAKFRDRCSVFCWYNIVVELLSDLSQGLRRRLRFLLRRLST